MATSAPMRCWFLEVPREIRDMVFCYLTKDHDIAVKSLPSDDNTHANHEDAGEEDANEQDEDEHVYIPPLYRLHGGPIIDLLLVNKQICAEYLESITGHMTFSTYISEPLLRDKPLGLALRPDLQMQLLKRVRTVLIMLNWSRNLLPSAFDDWGYHSLEEMKKQEDLASTPTKDLRPIVGPQLVEWETKMAAAFHEPTLSAMTDDTAIEWPKLGSLSIIYFTHMAPSRTLDRAEDQRMLAMEAGDLDFELETSQTSGAAIPKLMWRLVSTEDSPHYRGYSPEFLGES